MANPTISQIAINGTTYDACDSQARADIKTLQDSVNNNPNLYIGEKSITVADATTALNNNGKGVHVGYYIKANTTINGTTSNIDYMIAAYNPYKFNGDTGINYNHFVLVPRYIIGSARMNSTNTTEGGYPNTEMHKTTLPLYATAVKNALGSSHIATYRSLYANTVNTSAKSTGYEGWTGATSGWAWIDVTLRLMSEVEVYGAPIFSSSGHDTGEKKSQLPLFQQRPDLIISASSATARNWYWLSSVAYATHFCYVSGYGDASHGNASYSDGVRPLIIFKA